MERQRERQRKIERSILERFFGGGGNIMDIVKNRVAGHGGSGLMECFPYMMKMRACTRKGSGCGLLTGRT